MGNYTDDFLCVSLPSKIDKTYVRLQELLAELGLTVSAKNKKNCTSHYNGSGGHSSVNSINFTR